MIYQMGRLMLAPLTLAGHLFEGLSRAASSMEQIAAETFESSVRGSLESLLEKKEQEWGEIEKVSTAPEPDLKPPEPLPPLQETVNTENPGVPREHAPHHSEERKMADTNLNDDMVKLVEYSIVTVERRKEEIIETAEDGEKRKSPMLYLETDQITGDGFSNARIADWVKENPGKAAKVDLDTLRVYYNVLARWPKSDLRYDEEMLDIEEQKLAYLRQIRDKEKD